MTEFVRSDLSELGLPIRLGRPVFINAGEIAQERLVTPRLISTLLNKQFVALTGAAVEDFVFTLRLFHFQLQKTDEVILRESAESGFPLVVLRDGEIIVNFDILETRRFEWKDSSRPIYTYIPGFNVQRIPRMVRRPLSNFLQAGYSSGNGDVSEKYRRLPLTRFEFAILLLNLIVTAFSKKKAIPFHWPAGKRAVFVPFHDVDTGGFLKRGGRDSLFKVEEKHQIRSTWFIPTAYLGQERNKVEFLLESGHEIGWHGHNHDHRLPYSPFAERRVKILKDSWLCRPENYPAGMRTPKLLKSNHLFDLLDRSCSNLRYDTSFLQGIVPYDLWVHGRSTNILEIPITVPTDIVVWNALGGIAPSHRAARILETQIERTKKLIEAGGLISIVTHPEEDLSEKPELLYVYDQYLSFIKSCSDVEIMTGGELFRYWSNKRAMGNHSLDHVN
jgi:peptidoglycan-N-acetylglucosamine deacetylase